MRSLSFLLVALFCATAMVGCNETALGGASRNTCGRDCVGATPYCHPELFQCAECVQDNDCKSNQACTAGTGECVSRDLSRLIVDDPPSFIESAGTMQVPVRLVRSTAAFATEVSVEYTTQNGSGSNAATNSEDYSEIHGTLTFNAGETSKTISIPIIDDPINESDETFFIVLSEPTNAIIDDGNASATIADDDVLVISMDDQAADEGSGVIAFPITLSRASSRALTFNYRTLDGSAHAGSDVTADYTSVNDSITFLPGETEKTISVPIFDDVRPELPKSFTLELRLPNNDPVTSATGTINNDDGLRVSVDDASQPEHGTRLTFRVALSAASELPVSVAYQTQDNTAESGANDDYTSGTGTLMFAAGETEKQILVPINDDARDEDDESFFVRLSNPSEVELGDDLASGTIVDNDAQPTVSIANANAGENAGTMTFTANLSSPSGKTILVTYHTVDGSAVSGVGADYTAVSGTLTIPAGQSSGTISVIINNDSLDETDENFNLILDTATFANVGTSTATGTITDEDNPPTISIADASAAESASAVNFLVSLGSPSSKTISVIYATTNSGSAVAGASGDYTAVGPTTLTFAPGETSKPISVPLREDALDEADETLAVTLTSPTNVTIGDGSATGTILDNDNAPTVSIAGNAASESATSIAFTLTLSAPSSLVATVSYATNGATAATGSDYTPTSALLTFNPGETSKTVSVPIINDVLDEADETFTVFLGSPTNVAIGSPASAIGTIQDNDSPPSLSIANASATEGNSVVFSLTLNAASGQSLSVAYATTGTSAVAGTDFTSVNSTLTFNAGETSKTISVSTTNDSMDESDETFTLTLSSPTNVTLGTSTATGTITNNDSAPVVSIANASASEAATSLVLNVTLNVASGKTVTVNYATSSGSASAGSDYTTVNGVITFSPGETSKTIAVPLLNDMLSEGSETFTVTLTSPSNATLGTFTATGTITDDEGMPTLSIGNVSAGENTGNMTFTVSLSAASGQSVTVSYATANGTATTSGSDYTMASGTLTFTAGQTSKTISVAIGNDALNEADESFTVTLMSPTNATLGVSTGTGTITNDDALPSLSIANASASENAGTMTFTVSLSAASGRSLIVDYATSNGTASGADYTGKSGTLTFAAGETSKAVSITITNDSADEPNTETLTVTLSNPSLATIGTATATGTINDDDPAPTLTIDTTAAYSESYLTPNVYVSLAGNTNQTVTVQWTTANGTAQAGSDFPASSGTLTFNPGDTYKVILVPAIDDNLDENDETFTISILSPSNAVLGTSVNNTFTIYDNDSQPAIGIADASIAENSGNLVLTVTLDGPSGKTITSNYATADATSGNIAIAGSDYTASSGSMTFAPGETTKTIAVPVIGDAFVEPSETFTVRLSAVVNATVIRSVATATIANDDTGPSLTIGDGTSIENGGVVTFAVTMSPPNSTQTVSVTYSTSNATALAGSDYTAKSGTLTFAPNETFKTFDVTISNDSSSEPSETFIVTLGTPTNASLTDSTGVGTIRNDDGFFAGEIDTGVNFVCAIKSDGSLWCWGANGEGQTGIGSPTPNTVLEPTRAGTDTNWASVSVGYAHACAIKTNGTLWCWGNGSSYKLGTTPINGSQYSPTQVGLDNNWDSVSAGSNHTCAVKQDGTLWCWGDNTYGQLGIGDATFASTPTLVGTNNQWQWLESGANYTCAVRSTGSMWCWGNNTYGQLGIGSTATARTPAQVDSASTWSIVSVTESTSSSAHTCATKANGTLWCWGYNGWGQLGQGTTGSQSNSPVQVGALSTWTSIDVGQQYACATKANEIWCWGYNSVGQLGIGTSVTSVATPTRVGTLSDWGKVAAGADFTCSLKTFGQTYCWGNNAFGQLANGMSSGFETAPSPAN